MKFVQIVIVEFARQRRVVNTLSIDLANNRNSETKRIIEMALAIIGDLNSLVFYNLPLHHRLPFPLPSTSQDIYPIGNAMNQLAPDIRERSVELSFVWYSYKNYFQHITSFPSWAMKLRNFGITVQLYFIRIHLKKFLKNIKLC